MNALLELRKLRKLRKQGIKPETIQRPYLLRYFDRMAILKPTITDYLYRHLTRADLTRILYDADFSPTCSLSACSFSPRFTPQREQVD